MPNRVLKESITTSETIDQLDDASEVLFYRLITKCDDFGRFDARLPVLLGQVYPLRIGEISAEEMERRLLNLAAAGLVILYLAEGKRYLQMVTWRKHQTVRASKSKYPEPPADAGNGIQSLATADACEQLQADESNCKQLQAIESNCEQDDISRSTAIESNCMQLKANVPARVPVPAPVPDYVPVPEGAPQAGADLTRGGMLSSDLSPTRYPLTHQVACWMVDDFGGSPFPLTTPSTEYRICERELGKLAGALQRAGITTGPIPWLQTRCLKPDIDAGLRNRGAGMLASLKTAIKYAVEDAEKQAAKASANAPAPASSPPPREQPTPEEEERINRDMAMIEKKKAYVREHGRLPRNRAELQEDTHV
ncbi:MAG: hypothetical protein ACYDCO_25520 [Armatimonadota bacterium]